ncbi:hypothetical protein LTR37_006585 [Vermiconidia calcicola]|uniref:Uncharacterized protein n=1 Tax=Vermiconidia calcicola TaxID=1690605 RepID=A0ACC3NG81_9PEZI|nr:hypothetical protein LTR37_006585 [Vermiconidia calcicola]
MLAAANTAIDKKNPAALPFSALSKDLAINTLSVLAAADEAVKSFRELPKDVPKAFIYTGNILNINPIPGLLSNGIGKAATAHLISTMAAAYRDEGFNFYYADERKADGSPAYAAVDGEAHARMYLQLAEGKESVPCFATFVKGVGYKAFSSDARSKV